jgi:hypothetical protein
MKIVPTSRVVVAPDVLLNVIDGESVLLNLKSERYFGLDEVGTRMWQVLAESRTIEEARTRLLDEYDVERGQLQRDLDELIEQLVGQGLVELIDEQVA